MDTAYIAIDMGAESGRVIVGALANKRLRLEEVHRFAHQPIWLPTGLHWDISGIWREIVSGLRRAADYAKTSGVELVSVGVDTWGVDWALVDDAGELVGLPHAYRDPRNTAAYEEVLAKLGEDRIYRTTGIQFMPLNSLYSLAAHYKADPGALQSAGQLLFMPDLLHFWLSGHRVVEATIASTSQMVDCHTHHWAREMLAEVGLPTHILGEISPPGTCLGTLRPKLADETHLPPIMKVVTPAAHDTASAVAAVPATEGTNWCYLSSGTWSLLGAEIDAPCVTPAAQEASFTNELGVAGKVRFLKNITGLWLVQECRRDFANLGQHFDYSTLTQLASQCESFRTLVSPDRLAFGTPGEMLQKINEFARTTSQPVPDSPGRYVRCCLESLALAYREKLELLEQILGQRFAVIHIVGGGAKNELLSRMTADATGRRVVVGPFEATAMGNLLVQGMASGEVRDLAELRDIIAHSFELATFEPTGDTAWDSAYERYRHLQRF